LESFMGRRTLFTGIRSGSFGAVLLFLAASEGEGRDCRVSLIPNGARFRCANCHVSAGGGGARTAFGEAVRPLVGTGCGTFWGPTLAHLDSDGDGVTNGEELQDRDGAWKPGQANPGTAAFVTNPGVKNPRFVRGDSTGDGAVNVADAVRIFEYLFQSGTAPGCRSAADANNDGKIDVSDPILLLFHLFTTLSVDPPAPYPGCGIDQIADTLDCRTLPACP
jgi:Dockerin type I domain